MQDVCLNDIWTFYFHDPFNDDWTLKSYIRLRDVSTVHDFWNVHFTLFPKLKHGMFFLMREHVFPCWDDEHNKNGGCLSIKVLKENVAGYWEYLCVRLLGETLLLPDYRSHCDNINGISTSPKKFFCIIKIWLKTNELTDPNCFDIPKNHYGDVIYRENMEHIQKNHES